jgi:hypothetical protein
MYSWLGGKIVSRRLMSRRGIDKEVTPVEPRRRREVAHANFMV